jgi:hypothetical protein
MYSNGFVLAYPLDPETGIIGAVLAVRLDLRTKPIDTILADNMRFISNSILQSLYVRSLYSVKCSQRGEWVEKVSSSRHKINN